MQLRDVLSTGEARVENPWAELPACAPFVLPSDAANVNAFNDRDRQRLSDCERLQLDMLPEPYIGRPDAPIVILRFHPGYYPGDAHVAANEVSREAWRRNILHEPLDFPFYLLDPVLAWTGHAQWWRRKFRQVIALSGERTVAGNILCIHGVPYRSFRHPALPGLLPSQQYSVALVDDAIDRDAVILMGNTVRWWHEMVPRLGVYPHLFIARVARGGHITPGYYPEGFSRLQRVLGERG